MIFSRRWRTCYLYRVLIRLCPTVGEEEPIDLGIVDRAQERGEGASRFGGNRGAM